MPAKQPKKKSGRTLFALGLGYLIDQGEAQAMGVLVAYHSKCVGSEFRVCWG